MCYRSKNYKYPCTVEGCMGVSISRFDRGPEGQLCKVHQKELNEKKKQAYLRSKDYQSEYAKLRYAKSKQKAAI